MAGWRDSIDGQDYANGRGWGYRMRENYGMTVTIAAQAGQAMSTVRDAYMNPIYKQLEINKNNSYDYVILEGGFNDIMGNEQSTEKETAPLGTMSDSYDLASFDRSTFASGLEHLLCYATTTFPNAKIGFIITFETPYSNRGNGTNDGANTKKYFDLAKQICDKWNVPYLDFYDGAAADGTKFFDIFYPEGRTLVSQYPNGLPSSQYGTLQNIKDDIHPNKAGYDATYGYIAQWMQTLPTYMAPKGMTTTSKTSTTTAVKVTTADSTATVPASKTTTRPVRDAETTKGDRPAAVTTGISTPTVYDDLVTVYTKDEVSVSVKKQSALRIAEFVIEPQTEGEVYDDASAVLRNNTKIQVYSIQVSVDGEAAPIDYPYVLTLPIPDEYDCSKIVLARIVDDTGYEELPATIDEAAGIIRVQTKRIGTFVIFEDASLSPKGSAVNVWTYILVGVACLLALAVVALVVILLIKRQK